MKLKAYNTSDLNMYLSNTYIMHENIPVKITSFEGNGSRSVNMYCSYSTPTGRFSSNVFSLNREEELELGTVPTGYYNVGNFVVYIYRHQRSHFKKALCNETIRHFIPQDRELRMLNVSSSLDYNSILLKGQSFSTLDEAYSEMVNNNDLYSVALHTNYALVKKGTKKDLVIYYKTDPVILYDGETLTPMVDDCHVSKFKMELDL